MFLKHITCDVSMGLSVDHFPGLLQQLENCLEHNFISGLLCIGGAVMMFHCKKLIQLYSFCPQVVAFGPLSTEKPYHYKWDYYFLELIIKRTTTTIALKRIACYSHHFQQSHSSLTIRKYHRKLQN